MTPHQPLSAALLEIVESLPPDAPVTLSELFDRTGDRGPYALLVLLSMPFITPVSLPGISNVLGVVMTVIGWKLVRGHPPHLPRFAGRRAIRGDRLARMTRTGARVLRVFEKFVRPRRSAWLAWPAVGIANGLLITLMALMLALPIPPTIPPSNTLPGYAIILLAFSIMEEDGVLIWAAYAATFGCFVYLVAMVIIQAGAIIALYSKYWDRIMNWFH